MVANGVVVTLLSILEREWGFHFEASKRVIYERIDLITPDNEQLLLEDLRERTGLVVTRVDIGAINFLRDTAELVIHYDLPGTTERGPARDAALRGISAGPSSDLD